MKQTKRKKNFFLKRKIKKNCLKIIKTLSEEIGIRSLSNISNLNRTKKYIINYFQSLNSNVTEHKFRVKKIETSNIIAEIKGSAYPEKIIIIGAHYDTVDCSKGANDNGSGIAGLLESYRIISKLPQPKKTIRFIAFSIEEPPFFSTNKMGSMIYAYNCKKKNEKIVMMISLDMIGFGKKSVKQKFPLSAMAKKYPESGNFLIVASLPPSSRAVHLWEKIYNINSKNKIYPLIAPASLRGIEQSDHLSFNKQGYQAIMLTDTGFYRSKNYHTMDDTIKSINFNFLAENIISISDTLYELSNTSWSTSRR